MEAWQSLKKQEALWHVDKDGKFWFEPGDKAEAESPAHGNVFYKLSSPSCESVLLEAPAAVIAIGLASTDPSSMTEAEKRDKFLQPDESGRLVVKQEDLNATLELWTTSVTDKDGNFENDIGIPGSSDVCVRPEGCDRPSEGRKYKKGETIVSPSSNFYGKFLLIAFLTLKQRHTYGNRRLRCKRH